MDNPTPNENPVTPPVGVPPTPQAQPQIDVPQQPSETTPQQSTVTTPPPKSKRKFIFIAIGIIIVLIIGVVGYFIYNSSQQKQEIDTVQPTPSPMLETQSPTSVPTLAIAPNWSTETSSVCNVVFPLPPKEPPYYQAHDPNSTPSATDDTGSGRNWQFEEYEASMFMFNTTSRIIYRAPEEASGFVPGNVEIICSPNTKAIDTKQLYDNLESLLGSQLPSEESVQIKSASDSNMWGHDVKVVTFEGGMFNPDQEYYIFATPKNLFLIRKIAMLQTEIVQDTTDRIFNNLQFLE